MILFLENCVLPNIKPDLSDLVKSYARNICEKDIYHNIVVDKYEMSKHWNVPFIELVPPQEDCNTIVAKIGTYQFESVKRGEKLLPEELYKVFNRSCFYYTLYDFSECPRNESSISLHGFGLPGYFLESVVASYKNLGNCKSENRYWSSETNRYNEFSNELISFLFKFRKEKFIFEIKSDDLVHKVSYSLINDYEDRKTEYKKDLFYSYKGLYDYGEARSIFCLIDMIKEIETLIQDGMRIQDIDFETFGTKFVNGKIIERFEGFTNSDEFLLSIICSKVQETEDAYILEYSKGLTSKMIPYYRFLFENIVGVPIMHDPHGKYFMSIRKDSFDDKEFIIPFILFNVIRNIDNISDYSKYIHANKIDSDDRYSQIVAFKPPISCFPFELRMKDILKLEAKDIYDVLYRTGDRDDVWWRDKSIKLVFNCEIDTATIYAIKQTFPGITYKNNVFEYLMSECDECDRQQSGHRKDYSEEYRSKILVSLCKTMFNLYKSGIWNNL